MDSVTLRIKSIGDEGYVVRSDQLKDLFATGRTIDEAVANAQDVIEALIESCAEHGDPYPIDIKEPEVIEKKIPLPAS
jgi:predicted RNase H-like HicB family nuclease